MNAVITVPAGQSKELLKADFGWHAMWIQLFDATNGLNIAPGEIDATNTDFYLPKSDDGIKPAQIEIQASGGDQTLVNSRWSAFNNTGDDVQVVVGRW